MNCSRKATNKPQGNVGMRSKSFGASAEEEDLKEEEGKLSTEGARKERVMDLKSRVGSTKLGGMY